MHKCQRLHHSEVVWLLQSPTFTAELKAQQLKRAKQLESEYASDSANLKALTNAAVSYTQVEDFKKAEDLLRKLIAASPDSADAWRQLVCVLLTLHSGQS